MRALRQRHLLGRVVRGEAVPRLAALARPALTAHRPPVQDHEVARRNQGHIRCDGLHHARGLVAEQEREPVIDATLAVVQIGVAHPARLHLHHHFTRAGVRDVDRHDLDRRALAERDHTLHLLHRAPFRDIFRAANHVGALQYWCTAQAQYMFRHV